jgi:hypothetical protein
VERASLRWFRRYLDEAKGVSLLQAQIDLAALAELRVGSDAAGALLVKLVDSREAAS